MGRRARRVLERGDALVDLARVGPHAADRLGEALEDPHALGAHELLVDARADLDLGVVDPGGVGVGPALDAVGPPAASVGATVALHSDRPRLSQCMAK